MKRALTGIAAAAVVLGTAAPMAFAATENFTNAGQVNFSFDGTVVSSPYILDGQDSGNTTAFAPIYYFDQLLNKAGITATWNGNTHTWALSDSSIDASKVNVAGGVGTGNTTITLNGTTIKKINTYAAQDPAAKAGQMTTYFPVYYVQTLFAAIGINATWNGSTGLSVTDSATTTAAALSQIQVSGQTLGSGSQVSPAITTGSGAITLSTTLTDGNGVPVAGGTVNLKLSGGLTPIVTQGSNTIAPNSDGSYTVTTGSNGVATVQVKGVGAYTATFTYGSSTQSTYIGFVASEPVISPSAAASSGFSAVPSTLSNSTAGVVPVTVTLPLNSSGQPQSGVNVTFTLNGDQKTAGTYNSAPKGAYITNSTGTQNVGTTYTTTTDSNGQATIYVNDFSTEEIQVSAAVSGYDPQDTYINYAPASTSASLSAISAYVFSSQIGSSAGPSSVTGVPSTQPVYFAPFTSAGLDTSDTLTYNLSATNGATITEIDGQSLKTANTLLSGLSNVQVTVTPNGDGTYTVAVDGVNLTSTATTPYFSVQLGEGSAATSTLTVASGSISATATVSFSNSATNATSFTPVVSTLAPGSSENVTFEVVDTNGNPVANQATTIAYDPSNAATGVWITAINGTALAQNLGTNGGSVLTPIPLWNKSTVYGVSIPSLVSWTEGASSLNVFTDSKGDVTLTLQNGNVSYYTGSDTGVVQDTADKSTSGQYFVFTGNSSTDANTYGAVYLSASQTAGATQYGSGNSTQIGEVNW